MARKKKEELGFDVNSTFEKLRDDFKSYLLLSRLLFDQDCPECPYRINELKPTFSDGKTPNKFYQQAKDMADELKIKWDDMTAEESNRIMLNMLGDIFMNLAPKDKEKKLHVKFTITIEEVSKYLEKQKEKEKEDANAASSTED